MQSFRMARLFPVKKMQQIKASNLMKRLILVQLSSKPMYLQFLFVSIFQTSVVGREHFQKKKPSLTAVSENIFEFFFHQLISRIFSHIYRKGFRKYYVSNLRRPMVNRRFETKITQNLRFFECQFHPLKIIGHSIFGMAHSLS